MKYEPWVRTLEGKFRTRANMEFPNPGLEHGVPKPWVPKLCVCSNPGFKLFLLLKFLPRVQTPPKTYVGLKHGALFCAVTMQTFCPSHSLNTVGGLERRIPGDRFSEKQQSPFSQIQMEHTYSVQGLKLGKAPATEFSHRTLEFKDDRAGKQSF